MEIVENLIKEYKENIEKVLKHKSYINQVSEYNGYIFKKVRSLEKFQNEVQWLKKMKNMKFDIPEIVGSYKDEIIITKKIEGTVISDENAQEHLYNIGKLLAKLHSLKVDEKNDWKTRVILEYTNLKCLVQEIMNKDVLSKATKFIEKGLEKISDFNLAIIHKDLRPENVILSDGKYYLLDLESMCVGDIDYDFTRIFNLLNQKEIYQYEDFKNLMDGYRTIKNIQISEEKWQLYNKFYAFRIYARMLSGKIDRDIEYEKYLEKVITSTEDKVTKWIKKYNNN